MVEIANVQQDRLAEIFDRLPTRSEKLRLAGMWTRLRDSAHGIVFPEAAPSTARFHAAKRPFRGIFFLRRPVRARPGRLPRKRAPGPRLGLHNGLPRPYIRPVSLPDYGDKRPM